MTEQEYIDITDLQRIVDARNTLREIVVINSSVVHSKDYSKVMEQLSRWEDLLRSQVKIKEEPGWISVYDELPERYKECLFIVGPYGSNQYHGRVMGGRYTGDPESPYHDTRAEFSTPGMGFLASHWMYSPENDVEDSS